jgi:hypothetical protein
MYKKCGKCRELKLFSEFYKDKSNVDGIEGHCKICRKKQKVDYYSANRDCILECRKKYAEDNKDKILKYKKDNEDRIRSYGIEYYALNKEERKAYREKNKLKIKLQKRLYRSSNRSKFNAKAAKRRSAKLKATPKWLTCIELQQIEELYEIAQAFKLYTGDDYHVDHIVPLQGKNVCGLHVPWNLQVLLAKENLIKHNKFIT